MWVIINLHHLDGGNIKQNKEADNFMSILWLQCNNFAQWYIEIMVVISILINYKHNYAQAKQHDYAKYSFDE